MNELREKVEATYQGFTCGIRVSLDCCHCEYLLESDVSPFGKCKVSSEFADQIIPIVREDTLREERERLADVMLYKLSELTMWWEALKQGKMEG